jgi:hypothetical protein
MTNLSPAAQAVAEAYWRMPVPNTQNHQLAAAFRAVVHGIDYITSEEILAIADELDGLS